MSKRDDRVSLVDMLIHAREAVDLLGEASADELKSDRVMQLALMRLVEIVGEAANRISPATQQRHPEIPWPLIIEMRNRIVHEYDNYRWGRGLAMPRRRIQTGTGPRACPRILANSGGRE